MSANVDYLTARQPGVQDENSNFVYVSPGPHVQLPAEIPEDGAQTPAGASTPRTPKTECSGDEEQHAPDSEVCLRKKYGFRDRIGCYTWTWFTMTMATGGIANVLHAIPYRAKWLRIVGSVIMLFNMVLYIMNIFFITLRFRWNKGSLKRSVLSPSESLFIPAAIVSLGTILINLCQYGIPMVGEWFHTVMQVLFWTYVSLSFIFSAGIYLIMWSTQVFPIHTMTPIWIFPAYPLLLIAPFAANLIDALPSSAAAARINSLSIAFCAVCLQGTGFLVSLMIYSALIYRLMTQKLPQQTTRPGMFVSVGPSGFTVAGIVHLGNVMEKVMPDGYKGITDASILLKLMSDLVGLWMWGLCLWFFVVSVGAHWQVVRPNRPGHHIAFDMTWYSFVFPNTALVTATLSISKAFSTDAIKIFGTILAGILVCVWICVFSLMLRAIYTKRILWPGNLDGAEISRRIWTSKDADVMNSASATSKDYVGDRNTAAHR